MSLFAPTFDLSPYTYRGEHLREITFPLGGIGTGSVTLDGRGGLRDWEIFNRPNKGSILPYTFPMLWWQEEGEEPNVLAVQGPRHKNWMGDQIKEWIYGHGLFFDQMDGLPHFDEVELSGTFPFARLRFLKESCPLEVELCAFSPFIPHDVDASAYPGAALVYRVKNRSDKPIQATLAWSMTNPVGLGVKMEKGESDQAKGEFFESDSCRGIRFSNDRFGADSIHQGTAALSTNWSAVTILPQWDKREWYDSLQALWTAFSTTGRLEGGPQATTQDRTPGSLGALLSLAPGEQVEVPFFISWVFPLTHRYWGAENSHTWTPHYATVFPDATDAANSFFANYDILCQRTRAFEEHLFTSGLPREVIHAVSATASTLHTPTVLRLQDGTFWAWEGCGPDVGSCPGTCSHVWNYALTHAYLFPKMQESMRRADYAHGFNCGPMGEQGAMNFRQMVPLGDENPLWHAASDGQLGGVVQLYRDWRITGNDALLHDLWPAAKRALEFAWVQWDTDRDGLVDGDQHNTYDINFQGPNPLTQFFYLAALRAGEEICQVLGDESGAEYRRLYESGRTLTEQRLWNGEYFVQENPYTEPDAPKYQHGHGCLSDQLLGQLSASIAGLGYLVNPELVKGALRAIYQHNFKSPLGDHVNLQRVYAIHDEPGLLLCSWPNGGRPYFPFVYSDEVWTGIEYQVATHLALEGMKDEALEIVRGIQKRYDGTRRSPWNELECGSHYARAMAAYGLWIAFGGENP